MDRLARDYLKRAKIRLEVLKIFYEKGDYPDVVREAKVRRFINENIIN